MSRSRRKATANALVGIPAGAGARRFPAGRRAEVSGA